MNHSIAYKQVNKIRENSKEDKWLEDVFVIGIDKLLAYRDLSALMPEAVQCFEWVLILKVHQQFECLHQLLCKKEEVF